MHRGPRPVPRNPARDAQLKREAVKRVEAADGVEALRMAFEKTLAGLPQPAREAADRQRGRLAGKGTPAAGIHSGTHLRARQQGTAGRVGENAKELLALQLAVCLCVRHQVPRLRRPQRRRVLLVNLENTPDWQHRRLRAMCATLGVTADLLGDRLEILNGRGRGVTLADICAAAPDTAPWR